VPLLCALRALGVLPHWSFRLGHHRLAMVVSSFIAQCLCAKPDRARALLTPITTPELASPRGWFSPHFTLARRRRVLLIHPVHKMHNVHTRVVVTNHCHNNLSVDSAARQNNRWICINGQAQPRTVPAGRSSNPCSAKRSPGPSIPRPRNAQHVNTNVCRTPQSKIQNQKSKIRSPRSSFAPFASLAPLRQKKRLN